MSSEAPEEQDVAQAIRTALRGRRVAELPSEDAAELAENYRNSLTTYRQHSLEYLEAGDYLQAAEKSWGAFAESVKSIAADHRFRVSHHGAIIQVCSQLVALAARQDPGAGDVLGSGLDSARSLHQHFYENDLPAERVRFSTRRVAAAIDLMQDRFSFSPEGRPADHGSDV